MTHTKPQLLNLETIQLRLVKVGLAWIEYSLCRPPRFTWLISATLRSHISRDYVVDRAVNWRPQRRLSGWSACSLHSPLWKLRSLTLRSILLAPTATGVVRYTASIKVPPGSYWRFWEVWDRALVLFNLVVVSSVSWCKMWVYWCAGSRQTGDAAFTPATPHDLHHSRANNDSQKSHKTQHTRVKQNKLCFTQKDTQPSQTCSGGQITPNTTPKIDAGDASLLMGSIN